MKYRTKYPITIYFVEDGQYYFAYLPDFGSSACSATGETIQAAVDNLAAVEKAVTQHYLDTGRALPHPTPNPALA